MSWGSFSPIVDRIAIIISALIFVFDIWILILEETTF
jgi:hypothetical protein